MSLILKYLGDSVLLPSPEFGDEEEQRTHAIYRITEGGNRFAYRDQDWFKLKTFTWDIRGMNRETRESLRTFLINTAGLKITTIDHLYVVREGYITINPAELVTMQDATSEVEGCEDKDGAYDINLQFMQDPDNDDYYLVVSEFGTQMILESEIDLIISGD